MGLGRMPNHVPKFSEQARAARVGGLVLPPQPLALAQYKIKRSLMV